MDKAASNPITSTPIHSSKFKEKKNFISPYLLIPLCTGLLMFVLWVIYQNAFIRIFKGITAGCLLVYYSWELIYFDSVVPGIHPSSPLSPPNIRMVSGHTLHLNYALALLLGVFVTIFVGWYL